MKILVVDDELVSRKKMQKIMENLGECEAVETGEDALKIVMSENPPDLILLDIIMPGMDGYEVLETLKGIPQTKEIPVIFLSALDEKENIIRGIEMGAVDYISKPFHKAEVKARVCTHLSLKEKNIRLKSLYDQLQQQHKIAEKVFANLIVNDHVGCPNIKHFLSPVDTVGGDLILTAAGPSGNQYVFVGDFTGHGLSAAIGAIPVSETFYTMAGRGHSIEKFVKDTNRKLNSILPTGLFLCACFMELDYTRGRLTLWNGGLPDALIIGREGGIKKRLSSTHLPLGVVNNDKLDTDVEVVKLAQGDFIYTYTDGVIEAVNTQGERFGQERIEEHFAHIREPEGLFDEICRSLADFRGDAKQNDDITVMEVRYDSRCFCKLHRKIGSKPGKVSRVWKMTLELGPDDMRTNEAVQYLIEMLMEARKGLGDHKENMYLILSELFTNALDYGILALNSTMKGDPQCFEAYHATRERRFAALKDGWIRIGLELFHQDNGGRLVVHVEDSGQGFDYKKTLPELSENLALGGRGIQMVRSLCKDLVFYGKGNRVKAVYSWEEQS